MYQTVKIATHNAATIQIIEEYQDSRYRIIISKNGEEVEARRLKSQGIERSLQTGRHYAERM